MIDTDIKKYLDELNIRMVEQLTLEAHKGINRMICIIREYGREWDKKYENDMRVKQGGFVKLVKRFLIDSTQNEAEKQALSHL